MDVEQPRDPAAAAARQLRVAGIVLILAGMSVTVVLERVAHWRALLAESQAKLLVKLEEPGSIVTMAGISLLEAGDSNEKKGGSGS